jgi:hypothetical protein
MANSLRPRQSSISRIWRTFGLHPHRVETFKLSKDPLFIDKVRDIVGLSCIRRTGPWCSRWMNRVRFKRWIAARPSCRSRLPYRSRARTDYRRHGTTTLFAALDVATGHVIGDCHRRHRSQEFLQFLMTIDGRVTTYVDIHFESGQLLDAHKPTRPPLAGAQSAVPCPFHAAGRLVAQPRRTLIRAAVGKADQARRPLEHPCARRRHS